MVEVLERATNVIEEYRGLKTERIRAESARKIAGECWWLEKYLKNEPRSGGPINYYLKRSP